MSDWETVRVVAGAFPGSEESMTYRGQLALGRAPKRLADAYAAERS